MKQDSCRQFERAEVGTACISWKRALCAPSLFASIAMLTACASAPANATNVSPDEMARVQHACAVTMGLNRTESDYGMCTGSLLASVAGMERPKLIAHDRAACAARGLQPGTPAFALCVVDEGETNRN